MITTEHFSCSRQPEVEHKNFVLTGKYHKFIAHVSASRKCTCEEMEKGEVCGNCVVFKNAMNCCAAKICMQQFPEHLKNKMMPLDVFLKDKLFFVSRVLFLQV